MDGGEQKEENKEAHPTCRAFSTRCFDDGGLHQRGNSNRREAALFAHRWGGKSSSLRVVVVEILSFKREVVIDVVSQGRLNSIGEGRAESEQHRRPGAGVLGLASGVEVMVLRGLRGGL